MNARKTEQSHLKIPIFLFHYVRINQTPDIFFLITGKIPRGKGKDAFRRRRDMLFFNVFSMRLRR